MLHHYSPAGANSKELKGEKQEPTPLRSSHLQKPETSIQVNKATGMATNRCDIVSYVMCQKEYKREKLHYVTKKYLELCVLCFIVVVVVVVVV